MFRKAVLLFCFSTIAFSADARRRAVTPAVHYPQCGMVTGTAAVTFTRNDGLTLAQSTQSAQPLTYTYGVATLLDEADTVVAWNRDDLLISTDGGCSWRVAATIPGSDFPPTLTPARGGRVYAWSDNREFLVRYDARGAKALRAPTAFSGLTPDATNADRVRAAGTDGSLWETLDGGESWSRLGGSIGAPLTYRVAFNPNDLDHIVAGTLVQGALFTHDAGRTWTRATGIAPATANVFQVLFSPADPNRVWAMGINDAEGNEPSRGRHIYLSDDGGATYRPVVDEAPGVKLINGPTMAAHPTSRDVLYFTFGTHFYDYGTDLFRYDAASNALTMTHNAHDGINAIAFSRTKPNVMYLGVEEFQGGDGDTH
jgi:hypothetical protein